MADHSPPHPFYVRELPVPVHTKFIEDHAGILKELLDVVLPADWIVREEKDFALRYGFRRPDIHAQIRVLDDTLRSVLGYDACSLPLDDAAWLQWMPKKVFIIENQICYLTFPKVVGSVAIFGEGFKSKLSKNIPWLEKTELFCWFDLDAAGFEMLNMIRQQYPHAKNFLMDKATYSKYEGFAVENNAKKRILPNLHADEALLYEFLTSSSKRLEQERITQDYILEILQGYNGEPIQSSR